MATLLLLGLLPLVGVGLAGNAALGGVLSVSLRPLETVLDHAAGDLERCGAPAARTEEEISRARLLLAQAELARQALVRRAPWTFLALFAVAAAALTGAALLLGRALSRPIAQLTDGMVRVAAGDLSRPVPVKAGPARDELQFLIDRFNRMGAQLQAQRDRLAITEQLAAWQDVARSMAHELKNPLTAMKMALARLGRAAEREEPGEAMRESVALLEEEVEVLIRMTQSFSEFARLPRAVPVAVPLRGLLEELCALYRNGSAVEVECEAAEVTVEADPDQLRRALGNLLKNAVEASRAGDAAIRVSARAEGAGVRIVVEDGGAGIGAALEGARLTRGLATTKAGGSGLGLPISQKIIHDHGGSLRLEPRAEGRGTRAIVELPVAGAVRGAA